MPVLSSSSFSALVADEKIGKDELFLSTGWRRTFGKSASQNGLAGVREAVLATWARDGTGGLLWNNGPAENV